MPRAWLRGSPFSDFRVPSAVLGVVVGGTSAFAAAAAWRDAHRAGPASIVAGTVLTGWIVAQVGVIGLRSPLQPAMAAVGAALVGLAGAWRDERVRDRWPAAWPIVLAWIAVVPAVIPRAAS